MLSLSCAQDLEIPPVRGEYVQDVFELRGYGQLPYNILFPENYNGRKRYPLVFFLHGAGERGIDNQAQLKHIAPILSSKENQEKYPAIIVFPQCPTNDYWATVDRSNDQWNVSTDTRTTAAGLKAEKLLDFVIENYQVDTSRIYLNGLSMGAFGTYSILARKPEKVAAAIAICGGSDVNQAKKFKHIPLQIFHGEKDSVVPVSLSRDLATELKKLSAPFTYTEYPEMDHNIWNTVFEDPKTLAWLFSQKKNN